MALMSSSYACRILGKPQFKNTAQTHSRASDLLPKRAKPSTAWVPKALDEKVTYSIWSGVHPLPTQLWPVQLRSRNLAGYDDAWVGAPPNQVPMPNLRLSPHNHEFLEVKVVIRQGVVSYVSCM